MEHLFLEVLPVVAVLLAFVNVLISSFLLRRKLRARTTSNAPFLTVAAT